MIISVLIDALFSGEPFDFIEDVGNIVSQVAGLAPVMQFPLMQKYGSSDWCVQPFRFTFSGRAHQD